ncbi:rhodanese-like domain-containing protein [Octadecabacter sp. 1_MG-2023]|uniref:rhodanese-like domain-containing protein n=1 Tax=unclassified Octadecabacter TaxID=196158 RepID=UPI001C08CC5E|nr:MULTISPECIES: rhodanese-like domain-containing protein [unclassified Octadecabacter]MBU2992516.1 rhodanese-like domain-containing protein [Octadecabacter sp. B2R22]MDO6734727.1 rhodanese-like domain-containing protein [Octadecabacter sp. 1_MG-2023]
MNIASAKSVSRLAVSLTAVAIGSAVSAQDVRITTFKSDATFTLNGRTFTVSRDQNIDNTLTGEFARTSRACPPNCLQPMISADGVATLGELEVLEFMEGEVTNGRGLLLDTRGADAFSNGSILGAVNVPHVTLGPDNRYRTDILLALGAVQTSTGALDFQDAMALTMFSGGVWSSDARTAVNNLIEAGYPPEKLFYYRGGLQAWMHVGLTTQNSATSN